MKSILIITCLLFLFYYSKAQDTTGRPTCILSGFCNRDLRSPLPGLNAVGDIKDRDYCYAKTNDCDPTPPNPAMPANYHDVSYSGTSNNGSGCSPTPVDDCIDIPSALKYHVFYPSETKVDYATCHLPVVIFFHGGGFADCNGSYMTSDIQAICTEFAKRGYIAITVEYRLGVELDPSPAYYTVQQILGIWRAGQDARGAIRTIIKREMEGNEPFSIDVNKIFIAGNSAGSLLAMNVAYYNLSSMITAAFPSGISSSNVLGSINLNYYYGEGTGANAISYSIAGVLDMWGGILLPQNKTANSFFFQTGNTIPPTIAFCGKNDVVFKPNSKPLKFSPGSTNTALRTENRCLNDMSGNTSFTVSDDPNAYGTILGSQSIYNLLRTNHVLTEFYFDCQMHHGIVDPSTDNFGLTSATTEDDVNLYIVQRAATFFQAVMNGTVWNALATTKFVECVNYRHTCATADDNEGCYSDAFPTEQLCPSSKQ